MIFSNELISKSLRLPSDVVDYVEQQPGDNFTSKLVTLLREVRDGDQQRAENLAWYESTLKERYQKLEDLNDDIYRIQLILMHLYHAVDEIDKLPFT